jgi:SAM-dependent methyltransferase
MATELRDTTAPALLEHKEEDDFSCPVCGSAQPPALACRALLHPGNEKDVRRCADCEAAYFFPVPAPQEIAECYPHAYFRDFFKQYWKDYYKGKALAESIVRWKPKGAFLDAGCALGTLLAGFRDASGWSVQGLEYSPAACEMGSAVNGVAIENAGLQNSKLPSAAFDYVHANNVMEHESDPLGALRSAARLLKPSGRLHLVLPNGPKDLLSNRILYARYGKAFRTRHSGHLFYYARKSLEILLQRSGFKLVSMKSFHLKTALKARGWTPKAFKTFFAEERHLADDATALPTEAYRQLIPPRPSWPAYLTKYRWRRLWRMPNDWGYDFEILAEKVS